MKKKKLAVDDEPLGIAMDEPLPAPLVDKFLEDEDALDEATAILKTLAASTPAHMGTAHGIALIHSAQAWVAAHAKGSA